IQRALDNVAEECAEFAAAEYEAGEFAEGDMSARNFAEGLLRHTIKGLVGIKVKDCTYEISCDGDIAAARVSMDVDGLFRIFPSNGTRIVAVGRCQVEEAEEEEGVDGDEGGGGDGGDDGEEG
ncbi:MAG: hypothetical protein FWG42_10765, partial [Clostridiales bacterium]|nr:hypothetical protein [Clostridiales bacterium]